MNKINTIDSFQVLYMNLNKMIQIVKIIRRKIAILVCKLEEKFFIKS